MLEGEAAKLMAQMIQAYRWPENLPQPTDPDEYGATEIGGQYYGQDVSLELACALGTSETSARHQIADMAVLVEHLPDCWAEVISGRAPLWRGLKTASACDGLDERWFQIVDAHVCQSLGGVGPGRFFTALEAVLKWVDPDGARRRAKAAPRCVHTGGDRHDPLTGWLSARLDRVDVIYLEAIIQLIADTLKAKGDTGSMDKLRAKALGLLSTPAAVVELIGLPTMRGLLQPPETDADKRALIEACELVEGGVHTENPNLCPSACRHYPGG